MNKYITEEGKKKSKLDQLFTDNKQLYSKLLDLTADNTKLDSGIKLEQKASEKAKHEYEQLQLDVTQERKKTTEREKLMQDKEINLKTKIEN